MKKSTCLILMLLVFVVSSVNAQLDTEKYKFYRLRNSKSMRYLSIKDNHGSVNLSKKTADVKAIEPISGFDKVVDDPSTIAEIDAEGAGYYFFSVQNTTLADIVTGAKAMISDQGDGKYLVYATKKASAQGLSGNANAFLLDPGSGEEIGYDMNRQSAINKGTGFWNILPVRSEDDNNYFGVNASLYANGYYYTTLFTAFPYELPQTMTAYIVTGIENGNAVLKNIGNLVPAKTPVILESYFGNVSSNRLQPVPSDWTAPSDNLLQGVYFNHNKGGVHTVRTAFDKKTMRVLAINEGKITLSDAGAAYIPANGAYLSVPEGTPSVLGVSVTTGIAEIQADRVKDGKIYDLQGRQVLNPVQKGIYIKDGKKVMAK